MSENNWDDRAPLHDPNDEVTTVNSSDIVEVPPVQVETPANDEDATKGTISNLFRSITWRQRVTVLIAAFVDFTAMACMSIMAPFLPREAGMKGISGTTVGIIFACFELVMFFGSIITGRYLTAIGARFSYIAGIFVAASCSILFGFLEWCPPGTIFAVMAIACRIVEAIGCSMCETASMAIVANEFPDRVATVFGLLESVASIGLMAGPLIGGALYDLGGFFLPFVVVGIVFFLSGIVAAFTLPPTAVAAPKDKSELFRRFIKMPAVFVCGICTFTCAMASSFLDPILANQLASISDTMANSQTLIGLMFLIAEIMYALLSPFVGYFADNCKHQLPLLAMGNLGFMLSYLLIGPCPLLPIPPRLLWLTIVSLVSLGFFWAFAFMPAFAVLSNACKDAGLQPDLDLFGYIAGYFGFAFSLGGFAGPLLAGILVDDVGFEWSSSIMGLVPIIDLLVIVIFAVFSFVQTRNHTSS